MGAKVGEPMSVPVVRRGSRSAVRGDAVTSRLLMRGEPAAVMNTGVASASMLGVP